MSVGQQTLQLVMVVLNIAQVVPALGDRPAKSYLKISVFFSGKLWISLANVSYVILVIESISIPAEGFGEEISRSRLTDELGHSEKARDRLSKGFKKFDFLYLASFLAIVTGWRSCFPIAAASDDVRN